MVKHKSRRIYPWREWLSRKRFVLTKGREFSCSTYIMAQMVRNKACSLAYRLRVSIRVRGNKVVVRVLGSMGGNHYAD